jgi:hypothetical protein
MDNTKIKGLVQFAGKKITLMFYRIVMSGGWAGHLFEKSSTFLFAEPILASNWWKKSTEILVVIHAFLFAW